MDDAGHFTLKLLPGPYTLTASYSDTGDSGPAQPVTVEAGKISRVRLTVPDSVTETSGVVLNSRGEPAVGASVSFVGGELYASTETDVQGRFSLKTSQETQEAVVGLHAEADAEEGEVPNVQVGTHGVVVRLVRAAALRGQLIATRGPPLQGFELHVSRQTVPHPS